MASETSGSVQSKQADSAGARAQSAVGEESSGRRRRSRKARVGTGRWGTSAGLLTLAFVVAMAPLAAGAVHRSTAMAAFGLTLLAFALVISNEWVAGVPIRISLPAAATLLVFLGLPL